MRGLVNRVALAAGSLACGFIVTLGPSASAGAALAPATSTLTYLYGVSCTSKTSCTAAGYSNTAPPTTTSLAEKWNGTKWAIQHTPNPSGLGDQATLNGVSCSSRTACTAVGEFYDPVTSTTASLAETWNGSKWTIRPTVNPPGHEVYLRGVSCSSPTTCTAIGVSFSGAVAGWTSLAERWNGANWTVQHTPNP